MCEFALSSSRSATTGYLPAYVVYGREPVLPLEHALQAVDNFKVLSVAERDGTGGCICTCNHC